jgi:phospholipid-transporting ATPase
MVSGLAFASAQQDEATIDLMISLFVKCLTVLIFRASPAQKAQVVMLVRAKEPKRLTLAVGDGFNDVNMIQKAQIGIGIQGRESNAAAAFSDFAVNNFKDLRRMMFWHGRGYGSKLHVTILIQFFKQYLSLGAKFMYNQANGMSAENPQDSLLFALYNVCMTNFLVSWWCAFNHDVDQSKFKYSDAKLNYRTSEFYTLCRKEMSEYY